MPATTTGAPFSLNVPSLSSDLADLFGTYLVPNMTAINTNAAHKGTAQTFSALQTFSAGLNVSSGTIILPAGSASAPSIAPSGDTNTGTYYPAADTIAWATGGSERVRVDSSGSVTIGGVTSTSGGLLSVGYGITARNIGASVPYLQIYNSNASTNLKTWRLGGGNGGDLQFETVNDAYSSATERMRITSSGNVGIGTSSPNVKLHLYESAATANFLRLENSVGSTFLGTNTDGTSELSASAASGVLKFMAGGGVERMRITSSGNVGIGTNSPGYQLTLSTDSAAKPTSNTWTISSDARVKTVLGDFTRGLMDIVGLMPKRYHLNGAYGTVDDGREHVSVIAQDVQTTWPAMVGEYTHVEKDEEAGTETETTLLSLNTNELQWALVNAIKELTARVVTLEAQIASA